MPESTPKPLVRDLTLTFVSALEDFIKDHPEVTTADLIAALDWLEMGLVFDQFKPPSR